MSRFAAFGPGHLGVIALSLSFVACSRARTEPETSSPNADQAWVQSVCERVMPDTTGWPRYVLGNISIAVPPQYKRARFTGYSLRFTRGDNTIMTVTLGSHSAFDLLGYNLPGQAGCDTYYGGYQTDALSWSGRGDYLAVARWQRLNEPDQRPSVQATIRTRRLSDAIALRASLHTIRRLADDPQAPSGNPDAWFHSPCASDSVDSFFWTRYDLHGIRIRIPREARRVPVPGGDELLFRTARATLTMRLHRDAHGRFREYRRPDLVHKYCTGDIGGLMAEAISFRYHAMPGFAASWPDADRGEYLTAVITGRTVDDVTFLRRALFTIQFPGERRR